MSLSEVYDKVLELSYSSKRILYFADKARLKIDEAAALIISPAALLQCKVEPGTLVNMVFLQVVLRFEQNSFQALEHASAPSFKRKETKELCKILGMVAITEGKFPYLIKFLKKILSHRYENKYKSTLDTIYHTFDLSQAKQVKSTDPSSSRHSETSQSAIATKNAGHKKKSGNPSTPLLFANPPHVAQLNHFTLQLANPSKLWNQIKKPSRKPKRAKHRSKDQNTAPPVSFSIETSSPFRPIRHGTPTYDKSDFCPRDLSTSF